MLGLETGTPTSGKYADLALESLLRSTGRLRINLRQEGSRLGGYVEGRRDLVIIWVTGIIHILMKS